jgi:hypothetical protein
LSLLVCDGLGQESASLSEKVPKNCRNFSGSTSDPSTPASAVPISTAQRSALIGLGNSAKVASPALLNILPSSEATFSDIRVWQAARRATVFSSDFSIIAE